MFKRGFIVLACVAALSACDESRPGEAPANAAEYTWTIVQSPITHRCYEIASHFYGVSNITYSSGGMAEVPCSEMQQLPPPTN